MVSISFGICKGCLTTQHTNRTKTIVVEVSGVARILLQGDTGAWRTGSEVRSDKVSHKVFLQQPATVTAISALICVIGQ